MTTTPRTRAEARQQNAQASRRSARSSGPGKPRKRKVSWPRRIIRVILVMGVLGVAGVVAAYAMIDTPKPNEVAVAQTSVIYYADGKNEIGRISEVNRQSVKLDQVPVHVQRAMLAAEDRDFYENSGISPTGITRAVWTAIKGGGEASQGGSTITQQYVKNYFLSQDRTISRKAREILIAVKIDGEQSKDEILENYLNTIYYGRGAYGIQTAAKAYFNKDASQLTVGEGAFLASVIRGPSYYDPTLGASQKKNATTRVGYVLDGMVSEGWLAPQERASVTFPKVIPYKPPSVSGPNGYVIERVKRELATSAKLSESDVARGGFKIVTTIDRAKQVAAQQAVAERLPKESKDLKVGMVSIKPGDGAIQTLYGGADYAKNQYSTATQAAMPAGSTFKVFTLIAALESEKVSIRNSFGGGSPQFFKQFRNENGDTDFKRNGGVRNFNNNSYGTLNLASATADSVNTIYAKLNILATPKKTTEVAKRAGVTSKLSNEYSNVLGPDSVKVIDMANAYATIAAEGVRAKPYLVKSVSSESGSFDYAAEPTTTRVFDKDLMSDVIYCMQQVVKRGSGEYAGGRLDRPAAGKTGTSSDNYSAWFDGYVPQLATAVGMFKGDGNVVNPDGTPKKENQMRDVPGWGSITGSTIPVRIWTDYMRVATEGMEEIDFPEPAYINKNARGATGESRGNNNNGNNNDNRSREPQRRSDEPSPSPTQPSPTRPSQQPPPTATPRPTPTNRPTNRPTRPPRPTNRPTITLPGG